MIPLLILHHEGFLQIDENLEDEVASHDSRILEVDKPEGDPHQFRDYDCLGQDRKRILDIACGESFCDDFRIILFVAFC